jgi:hypothetical protein
MTFETDINHRQSGEFLVPPTKKHVAIFPLQNLVGIRKARTRSSAYLLMLYALVSWTGLTSSTGALSSSLTLNLGPPALGRGGPNPVSIPPSPVDIGFIHVGGSQGTREISVSLSPGIFLWGYRIKQGPGPYASFGGGLITSANGGALGVYSAFGWDMLCNTFCFNAEYRQAIGLTSTHFLNPYAVRIGVSYWY